VIREPRWLTREGLIVLHDRSLALHGGVSGIRDVGLLDSALARARNRFHYDGAADVVELAATYAVAISANHPFVDGNKRAAYLALGLFLGKNGLELAADQAEAALAMFRLAAGALTVEELSAWVLRRLVHES
jgi:death-on-curing protein